MGWGPPTCLAHLIRDDLRLKVTCECGHTAELEPKALRDTVYRVRNDWWCELDDVRRYLRCGQCGGKNFQLG